MWLRLWCIRSVAVFSSELVISFTNPTRQRGRTSLNVHVPLNVADCPAINDIPHDRMLIESRNRSVMAGCSDFKTIAASCSREIVPACVSDMVVVKCFFRSVVVCKRITYRYGMYLLS